MVPNYDPIAMIQQYTYSESKGLNVDSYTADTIDAATRGSRLSQRIDSPYATNGSADKAWKRDDLNNAPPLEKEKSTEPAKNGALA